MSLSSLEKWPLRGLTAAFFAWKGFLLSITLGAAVGPSYDTSTSLYFERSYGSDIAVSELATRLSRWDALYFLHAARNGKIYEQEWAFGWGFSGVVNKFHTSLRDTGALQDGASEPLVAIVLASLFHWLAVLTLYQLTWVVFGNRRLAFLAALLHVLSPAGLFLSAPYAESSFAFLTFAGNLLFAYAITTRSLPMWGLNLVIAGLLFGASCLFRSNGVASGLVFAVEAMRCLGAFVQQPSLSKVMKVVPVVVGGLLTGAGLLLPQIAAWYRYCHMSDVITTPLWCHHKVPSIFTYVQEVYWDVGFLRYWTLNQLPLFLLAAPVLTLLIWSGISIVRRPLLLSEAPSNTRSDALSTFAMTLAAMQTTIAVLAITSYHVQIVTRLASAYPVWYWCIAGLLLDGKSQKLGLALTMFMTMYAGIQGALFASFLPPA